MRAVRNGGTMSDLRAVKQEDTGEWMSFREWLREVDRALKRACGLGRHDLPDFPYGDYYELCTVDETVELVLVESGFPVDAIVEAE